MESHSNSGTGRLSCFFCLRSNSGKYFNPKIESDPSENTGEAVSTFHEVSLRNIYRFLDLLHSDKEERDFKELKMSICEDCFRLYTGFNELYNLLEETKLRLNWYVQKFRDVMTKAEDEFRKSFQVELLIEEDVDEAKILEIWRTHTIDRMKVHTVTSFPRILLHKKKRKRRSPSISDSEWINDAKTGVMKADVDEKKFMPILRDETTEKMIQPKSEVQLGLSLADQVDVEDKDVKNLLIHDLDHDCHLSPNLPEIPVFAENDSLNITMECDAKMEEPHRESSSCQGQQRCSTYTEQESYSRNRRPNPVPALMSQKTKCDYCSFVCGAVIFSRRASMINHQVRFHPEHFLLDKSEMDQHQAGTPNGHRSERFRHILNGTVFPKFVKREATYAMCSLCGFKYESCNMGQNLGSVKRHLIFQHKLVLKEDLKIALENPLLNEDEALLVSDSGLKQADTHSGKMSSFETQCPYCSFQNIRNASSLMAHLVRFHPEHYLINEKDKTEGLWHEQFRTILTNMVYPSFISIEGRQRSCSLCGIMYKGSNVTENIIMVKRHLIFHHKMKLKEGFKDAVQDPSLEGKLSSLRKKRGGARKIYSSNCPYCPFESSSSITRSMVGHFIRFHPEHYLIDEKDRAEGLWHDQFRTILSKLVYPRFILIQGHSRSCSLCGAIYKCATAAHDVKTHLVFHHKTELKDKFKQVLEDPTFEEKLNT